MRCQCPALGEVVDGHLSMVGGQIVKGAQSIRPVFGRLARSGSNAGLQSVSASRSTPRPSWRSVRWLPHHARPSADAVVFNFLVNLITYPLLLLYLYRRAWRGEGEIDPDRDPPIGRHPPGACYSRRARAGATSPVILNSTERPPL